MDQRKATRDGIQASSAAMAASLFIPRGVVASNDCNSVVLGCTITLDNNDERPTAELVFHVPMERLSECVNSISNEFQLEKVLVNLLRSSNPHNVQ